jgi:hypothetical protein
VHWSSGRRCQGWQGKGALAFWSSGKSAGFSSVRLVSSGNCGRRAGQARKGKKERKIYARCQACVKGTRAWRAGQARKGVSCRRGGPNAAAPALSAAQGYPRATGVLTHARQHTRSSGACEARGEQSVRPSRQAAQKPKAVHNSEMPLITIHNSYLEHIWDHGGCGHDCRPVLLLQALSEDVHVEHAQEARPAANTHTRTRAAMHSHICTDILPVLEAWRGSCCAVSRRPALV